MKRLKILLSGAAFIVASSASAVTIDFDDLAPGTILFDQYAGLGVHFQPNAIDGVGSPTGVWATNTDMTIADSTGPDVGGLGLPPLASGNLLRSVSGWLGENGDASILIAFDFALSFVSLDFAGIDTPSSSRLFVFDGIDLIGLEEASTTGQVTLSFAAPSITAIIVTPGDFFDWVGLDNLVFEPARIAPVPEPAIWGQMIAGFALLGGALRSRRRTTVNFAFAAK